MKKSLLLIKLILVLIITNQSYAELEITSYSLDVSQYPILTGNFTVVDDGTPQTSGIKAIFIEDIKTAVPSELNHVGNGRYDFTFTTTTNNFNDVLRYTNTLVTYNNDQTAYKNITRILERSPRIFVTDDDNKSITELYMPPPPFNDSSAKQIRIGGRFNTFDGIPQGMIADSITISSDDITIKWLGPDGNPNRFDGFPTGIEPLERYWINVYYHSTDPNPYDYAVITLYFNGGNKFFIPVYAGTNSIESDPVLELISPLENEVLTPCELYEIKWQGHSKDAPVNIMFSSDDGATWNEIASVKDSVFNWTVPGNITDEARIKIYQDVFQSDRILMENNKAATYDVSFNDFGTELVSINDLGLIYEWDLFTQEEPIIKNTYYFDKSVTNKIYKEITTNYSNGLDKIAAARFEESENKSYVHFYESGVENAFNIFETPENYIIEQMQTDINNQYLALIPRVNSKMILLDPETGEFQNEIVFEHPILRAEFNNKLERLAVVLLNGDFILLNSNDFSEINRFQLLEFKLITAFDYSNNGEMLAMGIQPSGEGLALNYIVDIETGYVTRTFKQAVVNTTQIQFSPSSGSLVIGAAIGTQLKIYDLTLQTPNEEMVGHFNGLTDFDISSDGHALVSSAESTDNLYLRNFSFPEEVTGDRFIIQPALLSNEKITLDDAYIGTEQTIAVTNVCNEGDAFIDITEAFFTQGRNFRLLNEFKRDTLFPGECTDLEIVYMPLDTGRINDSLAFRVCGVDIKVPIEGFGLPRNFSYNINAIEFGEVCIGDTAVYSSLSIKNEDPVELILNGIWIENDRFDFETWFENIILQPGETHNVDVLFIPDSVKDEQGNLNITHSNQNKLIEKTPLFGVGIGAAIEVSHEELLFIPEILERELTITNLTNIEINISNLVTIPEGYFENTTQVPFVLKPNDSKEFIISWNGTVPEEQVRLKVEADPCVIQKYINLGIYNATSSIIVRDTTVGPLDEAAIKIDYSNTETIAYQGERFFEGVLTINPRLFFPESVESPNNSGEILSNEVINGLRHIRFRVNDTFDGNGSLALIKGIPGLAETNSSEMKMIESETGFGINVQENYAYGTFTVDDECEDRRIIRIDDALQIISISPNPAEEIAKIEFESEISGDALLNIYDYLGNLVLTSGPYKINNGFNTININISALKSGTYKIQLELDSQLTQESLIIMR